MRDISDLTIEESIDFMFLTETWLTKADEKTGRINELKPAGFSVRSYPRKNRTGGGVAILYRNTYEKYITRFHEFDFKSFQAAQICLNISNTPISFICVYRPTKSKINVCTDTEYVNELGEMLDTVNIDHKHVIVLGDLNIHFDVTTNTVTNKVLSLLDRHNMHQYITGPTHIKGHTLDVIIGCATGNLITSTCVMEKHISDHSFIVGELSIAKKRDFKKTVTSRDIKRVDQCCADY